MAAVSRIEAALLLLFAAGITLIAQPWVPGLYQAGLAAVMGASLCNIVVGNVPPSLSPGRAVARGVMLLLVLVGVFVTGYLLVPTLAGLGQ